MSKRDRQDAATATHRLCTQCHRVLRLDDFTRSIKGKFGRAEKCKYCRKAYSDARKHIKAAYDKIRMFDPDVHEVKLAKVRAWHKVNQPKRNRTPQDRLANNMRTRIRIALHGTAKCAPTYKLLGVSGIQELRQHIECKFLPGMHWGNNTKDGWHIDHIRPCASFDLTNPEEQMACFHHSNLQPMWAEDNHRKGDAWKG